MTANKENNYVKWFRNSAPYINAHRGKTFVLMFGGEAVDDPNFANIIHDIALLNSLGGKLSLVHGVRPQVEERAQVRKISSRVENKLRMTDQNTREGGQQGSGSVRTKMGA